MGSLAISSPIRRSIRPVARLVAFAATCLVLATCGDATGPSHPAVRIGESTEGVLTNAASVDSFTLSLAKETPVVVSIEPLGGLLSVRVSDPEGRLVGQASGDGSGASHELATRLITSPVGGRYLVRVSVPAGGTPSAYRLRVIRAVVGPERGADVVTIADTIADEAMDHAEDVDDFWLEAPPGSQVMAYIRTPGATPGLVELQVLLSGSSPTTESTGWDEDFEAGTPAHFTSLAGGRTYFRVSTTELGRGRPEFPLWYEMVFHIVEPVP